jgi:hypothetical protein
LYPYEHLQVYEFASLLHKPPFLHGLSEHLRTLAGAKVVVKVSSLKIFNLLKNTLISYKSTKVYSTLTNVKKWNANGI